MDLLLSVTDAMVTFGNTPLFENLTFNIHAGDKICLVGKNGAGKTTLMHMITGTKELDGGKRWSQPNLTVGYLQQDVTPQSGQTVFDYIFSALKPEFQKEEYHYMVTMVMEPLELEAYAQMDVLSGGQLRRAALARSLVEEPDILLLDEPTNHLDLGGIEWLENYLNNYRGTLLVISHDKTFLTNVSNKVFWLDRGLIRVCPSGFGMFEQWSEELLEQEARELENRKSALAEEVAWASKGVKARRKRNIRRLNMVKEARDALKKDVSSYRKATKKIELKSFDAPEASKIICEFYNVHKAFNNKTILNGFSFRVQRGARIGIIGKNGSGKTTFLKLLLKNITPDTGSVKLRKNLEVSYFDQRRSDLNPEDTLWKTLSPSGGDYVQVGGKPRHVCGYLKDFLFDPKSAHDQVGTLSGGQKNRLLLSRVLASPGNFLILDEPTNDLDMDTLDMLEEILSKYNGTLFVVSHDRDFLDQTVTEILAFEGNGKVEHVIGGYSDYVDYKKQGIAANVVTQEKEIKPTNTGSLSNAEKQELRKLPDKIERAEQQIEALNTQIAAPKLFTENPELFNELSDKIADYNDKLELLEMRWEELEEKSQSI